MRLWLLDIVLDREVFASSAEGMDVLWLSSSTRDVFKPEEAMADVSLVMAAVKVAAVAETVIKQATELGVKCWKATVPEHLVRAALRLYLSFR